MARRAVVIRTVSGQKIRIEFHKSAAIPEFVKRVREMLGDDLKDIHLLNLIPAKPAESISPVPGKLYCPYCEQYRRFVYDAHLDCRRCPICGISDRDFYVRCYNKLWGELAKRRPLSEEEKLEKRRERRRRRRLLRKEGRE